MKRTKYVVVVLALLAASLVATAPPAHAVDVDHGSWDAGIVQANCGPGQNRRTCTYKFFSFDCQEISTLGVFMVPCRAEMHATVEIAPILNAANRRVGCTSVVSEQTTGHVVYESFFGFFSNFFIDQEFHIDVKDTFGDGSLGEVNFLAIEREGPRQWIARGTFSSSCTQNFSQNSFDSTAPGSVTVQV